MSDDDTDDTRTSGWHTWGGRLLPALTFVVGLGLGLIVMMASNDRGGEGEPEAGSTPSETATASPSEGDTVVTVPSACQAAAGRLTEATRLLDDVAGSVRDFRPEELVDLLNQLEKLDAETRRLAAECSQVTVSESAAPSESPS